MIIRKVNGDRQGAVAVETGLVIIPLMMLIFGIFEYGWLLMNWNLVNNAAREGCRYALVNNTSSTISTQVNTVVLNFMGGANNNFTTFTVTVSGTHNGVSGQFRFMNILPYFSLPASFPISSSATMVCEGAS
jgi:Flp pilus assembly protein TadG